MEYDWIEMMERMQDIRLFCSLHVRRAKKGGISSAQELDLLSRVALSGEKLTSHMLCAGMGISKPVVSRLVDSLCRKEFLEKEACAADHRSYYLCITEKGREELDHTYKYYLEPLYSMRRRGGELCPAYGADPPGEPSGRGIRGNETITEINHSGS